MHRPQKCFDRLLSWVPALTASSQHGRTQGTPDAPNTAIKRLEDCQTPLPHSEPPHDLIT